MENYLYLLEFFVETITFSANTAEIPHPYEVVVSGSVGKTIKVDVFTVQNSISENEPHKELDLNCGRSILFASSPSDLLQRINENPFTISVFVKHKNVGEVQIGWTKDFYNLLKKSYNDFADLTPAVMHDQFLYQEKDTSRIMGDIKASVRMTCFGANLLTSYQFVNTKTDSRKKFLVKGAKGETTFECQKLNQGFSSEVLPLTTLFTEDEEMNKHPLTTIFENSKTPTMAGTERNADEASIMFPLDNERMSLMALFKSAMDPKSSARPEEFNLALSSVFPNKNSSTITFDIVSLMERPEENKYIDLRIKGGSQGLVFEFETSGNTKTEDNVGLRRLEDEKSDELTAENINKMLCKNKDCPAAKKFKDLGIGPLAKTKGLGGIYEQPSLPLTYGLSQTYGVFDEYGPYGLFSRPKRPSSPFIPKQESDWAASCWKPKRNRKEKPVCGCQNQKYHSCYAEESPLRLTGGGVLDYDDIESSFDECEEIMEQLDQICRNNHIVYQSTFLRLAGGSDKAVDHSAIKSPFHECKEVLDQMDQVLYKYKKALGPCGKTTCPFAPNITKESCKKMCNHEMDVYSLSNVDVPAPKESTTKVTKGKLKASACGSPKCPYAKYKLGLVDEDAEMELQYLPPVTSPKCGHPKCPTSIGDCDLPPIHWDCPDPLPTGPCKNPNCPYLPKEIKCLNAVLAKGPCGNFNCPFAPPDPCDSPYCPFQNKDCPYHKNDDDSDSSCDNPECPLKKKQNSHNCGNPLCPYASKSQGDSACPAMMTSYMQNMLAYYALMQNADTIQICLGNPPCQTGQPDKGNKSVTKKPSPCYYPDEMECSNPSCPHMKKAKKEGKEDEDNCSESCDHEGESCDRKEGSADQDEVCENPDCPYTQKADADTRSACYQPPEKGDGCGNPECPYAPPKPPCAMPFPPCANPLQALLSMLPISICPDGTCKYAAGKTLNLCFGGAECPYEKAAPAITEKSPTNDDDTCANPKCPYANQPTNPDELPINTRNIPDDEVIPTAEYIVETRTEVDNAPCFKKTCKSTGGTLICSSCPCGQEDGPEIGPRSRSTSGALRGSKMKTGSRSEPAVGAGGIKTKKKKAKSKYVYSIGDKYPGVQIGHKQCIMPAFNVPKNMGWLWNVQTVGLKPRRGWRPGALTKTIADRIKKHRESQGLDKLEVQARRLEAIGMAGGFPSGISVNVQPKPTLHIKKHDGCYWITMNPLKDPHTLVENESPYMDCTPLQFKIVKNKDKEKQGAGTDEYRSCFCGDDETGAADSSSSDSELEIEFTPPAGIIHPERFKKKKNVVHCDTQYLTTDFEKKKSQTNVEGKGKKEKKGKKGKDKKGKKGKKKK